ncbi:MAG: Gfo/Idh/MocA family protein [Alphaproteobacteria bacterium]
MSRRLKVGVVGGGVGAAHIDALLELPDLYEVRAFCDVDEALGRTVCAANAIPSAVVSYDALLDLDLDLIDLATPPHLHFSQALKALQAGHHVVVEKPLAGSLAEVDALAAAEADGTARLAPMFQYRFGNGLRRFLHLRNKGLVGRPLIATVATHWLRGPDYYAKPWRGRWGTELGGCLVGHAIHAHDLLTQAMGPVARVFARVATRVNPIETDDCAAVVLELASGAVATSSVTLGAQEEISQIKLCFDGLTVESGLDPYNPGYEPWRFVCADPERQRAVDAAFADFVPGPQRFTGYFAALHAALTTGAPLPVSVADARGALELVTALYTSARTGTSVTLPLGKDAMLYDGWAPGAAEAGR